MSRVGQIIGLKPDQIEAYERLHAAAWHEVLAMIHSCNIRNYSIFRHGELLLDRADAGAPGDASPRRVVGHDEGSVP